MQASWPRPRRALALLAVLLAACRPPTPEPAPAPLSPPQRAALESLQADLDRALEDEREVEVVEVRRPDERFLRIILPQHLLLPFGQARLLPDGRALLERLARVLAAHPGIAVRVVGHTDSIGSAAYNELLSLQQAQAVREALVAAGLPAPAVTAQGRGEAEPVADNATEAGRRRNRRIEIRLHANGPNGGGQPPRAAPEAPATPPPPASVQGTRGRARRAAPGAHPPRHRAGARRPGRGSPCLVDRPVGPTVPEMDGTNRKRNGL